MLEPQLDVELHQPAVGTQALQQVAAVLLLEVAQQPEEEGQQLALAVVAQVLVRVQLLKVHNQQNQSLSHRQNLREFSGKECYSILRSQSIWSGNMCQKCQQTLMKLLKSSPKKPLSLLV